MRPTPLMLIAVAAWTVVGILACIWSGLMPVFYVAGVVLVLGAAAQYWFLISMDPPEIVRQTLHSLPLGEWGQVKLRIASDSLRTLRMQIYDHHPGEMQVLGQPWTFELEPEGAVELSYKVRPTRRGERVFEFTQALVSWKGCLWTRSIQAGERTVVRVYPNFKAVARHALMAIDDQVRQLGVRRRRRRGTGLDFHQLREYREGDVLRQVDWKATSRQRKLISREYQEERDQRVVFVLDCGQRMHARDGDLSHFDHTLNAILVASYVALRQGDSIGLLTFSGMDRWLPPVKGVGGMTTMLNHVYDLHSTLQPSDYVEAARRVMTYLPRRSLIVLVTNVRDEDTDELRAALQTLGRRHIVLLASLRETVLEERIAQPVKSLQDAWQVAMASQFLSDRRVLHESIGGFGARVLDVRPSQLPPALVERYLDIKRAGAL